MSTDFFHVLNDQFNINLNDQQRQAVLHEEGPAVVLAVPGAGKTTVLICRTANLIMNHGVHPKNILSLTFSKSAAKDMKARFTKVFGEKTGTHVHFSTIHSFAYKLIREYAHHFKINYQLLEGNRTGINKMVLLKDLYKKINHAVINDDKLEELSNTIGYAKNMMIEPIDFHRYDNFSIKNFDRLYKKYEAYKKDNNLIDFDDMLSLSLEILKKYPKLLDKYRRQYPYIQVDEGQDTSKIQNEVIRLLAQPKNNLFVVADDDQSIYGFRGAFPEALLNFNQTYPEAKTFFMEQNYRSSEDIVSVSNEFIKSNTSRYKKNLFTNNASDLPVTIVKLKDEFSQLDYLLEQLQAMDDLSDTAILYRNNLSSISLIDYLTRYDMPFYMKDSKVHFFKHWVVHDMMAFLNLALNPHDIRAFERIYFKMNGYISKVALQYAMKQHDSDGVFDCLLKYPQFKAFQRDNIIRLKLDFKSLAKKNPYHAIRFILRDLEYDTFLKNNCSKFGYSYDNIKTILASLNTIAAGTNSIHEFLARLSTLQSMLQNNTMTEQQGIRLSTIHSSKGLEFENVFIIDLIDGDFPSTNSIDLSEVGDLHALEEERRLFYVGMTRSKRVLNLLTTQSRNGEHIHPSRFVSKLETILSDEESQTLISRYGFEVGGLVNHRRFGLGRIRAIEDDTATIRFDEVGIKKISVRISLEQNLLTAI